MNETVSILRKGRKFAQVLDSARDLFMQHGYENVSMEHLAQVAKWRQGLPATEMPAELVDLYEVLRS